MIGQSRWTGVYMDRVHDRSIKVDWGLYGQSMIGQSRWTGVYMDRVHDRSIKVDWGLYGQSP